MIGWLLTILGTLCVTVFCGLVWLVVFIRKRLGPIVEGIPKVPKDVAEAAFEKHRERGYDVLAGQYGRTYYLADLPLTSDKHAASKLFNAKPHSLYRPVLYKWFAKFIPDSNGLLFMDGEQWSRHHSLLTRLFQGPNIELYAPHMHRIAVECLKQWVDDFKEEAPPSNTVYFDITRQRSGGGVLISDAVHMVKWMGVRILLEWGLGIASDTKFAEDYGKTFAEYSHVCFDELPYASAANKVKGYFKLRALAKKLRGFLETAIRENRITGVPEGRESLLGKLLKEGAPFDEIAAGVNHLHGAHKAASLATACALFELSKHREWIETLRKEAEEVSPARLMPCQWGHLSHSPMPQSCDAGAGG